MNGAFLLADVRYNCPRCRPCVQRGDIAIFVYPNNRTRYYIKRIIGLPGDRIRIAAQQVFVNGQSLMDGEIQQQGEQRIITEIYEGTRYQVQWLSGDDGMMDELEVPPGEVFVLGDNRSASGDSRQFGLVLH